MKLRNRICFLVLAAIAMLGWAGCGSACPTATLSSSAGSGGATGGTATNGTVCGPGTNPGGGGGGNSAALLYYLGSSNILAAGLTTTGSFTAITSVTPPTLPSSSTDNMVIVNKKFLYVPMGDSTVQAFTIDRTSGALTTIPGSPFLAPGGADTAVSDPAGRFLFVGGEVIGEIAVFQINSTTGVLTPSPGSPFQSFNLVSADSMAVDGSGKFLYAGQLSPSNPVGAFSIDQNNGGLTEIAGSPFALGVATVHADASGKFLLGVAGILDQGNPFNDHHIYVFSIDPTTGAPTPVAGSPFLTTSAPFEFVLSPSGKFVYAFGSDGTGATAAIEGFQLDSTTGALTALPGSPFTTLPLVADCQFDQGGGAAFCIDSLFGTKFSVLTANPTTGALAHTVPDLTVSNNFPFAVTD